MADLTLVNFNLLYMRSIDRLERELHIPLGPLYLVNAVERAGYEVDFRDYQTVTAADPFAEQTMVEFLDGAERLIGISCMANLLPFVIMALQSYKKLHPECIIILGGVGPAAVERLIVERFPWIDIVARGEGERTLPHLVEVLKNGGLLESVRGITFRRTGQVVETPAQTRITDLDELGLPAYHAIKLDNYQAYNLVSSRGCPYPCTFCSVAPIWGLRPYCRSVASLINEMRYLHELAGVKMFLFQDEFFVSGKQRMLDFCQALRQSGLQVAWKCFGRVNLTDRATMLEMAQNGCIEIRYGVESGSDRILKRVKKGFTTEQTLRVIPEALTIFPKVDLFYMWGFPFETMDDFRQSLFQMIAFRMMGARILPSLMSFLPQTQLFQELIAESSLQVLEFCPDLFPEYMITGHEVRQSARVSVEPQHQKYFTFVKQHPDIFPGFFHVDLECNVLPKLRILQEMAFYPREKN